MVCPEGQGDVSIYGKPLFMSVEQTRGRIDCARPRTRASSSLLPSEHLSQNEIDAAALIQSVEFNAQMQQEIVWPANSVVARAYIDQLARHTAIQPARARSVMNVLARAEKLRSRRDRGAAQIVGEVDTLAMQLERDAAGVAAPQDAVRLRSLAAAIKSGTAKLR